MYLNFNVSKIVVLTGFEAAAYVNEHLGPLDKFGECELDDALEHGFGSGYVHPLCDDQFESWSLEPNTRRPAYSTNDISSERLPFYYVRLDDNYNRTALESLFNKAWLARREYTLRYRVVC
jgi:hypothetical protein